VRVREGAQEQDLALELELHLARRETLLQRHYLDGDIAPGPLAPAPDGAVAAAAQLVQQPRCLWPRLRLAADPDTGPDCRSRLVALGRRQRIQPRWQFGMSRGCEEPRVQRQCWSRHVQLEEHVCGRQREARLTWNHPTRCVEAAERFARVTVPIQLEALRVERGGPSPHEYEEKGLAGPPVAC